MGKLILYHGSKNIIKMPIFGFGNKNNDYGMGFYCTESIELAKEWACADAGNDGYANKYSFDLSGLSILDLSNGEYNILNWLAILLDNRNFGITTDIAREGKRFYLKKFRPDYKKYDVIKGYRADDSYFSFAKAFLNNTLSLNQLNKAMYLGKLGEQIVPKTKRAFDRLEFLDCAIAEAEIYHPKYLSRDTNAREEYRKESSKAFDRNTVYSIDIIREDWNSDDPRIQRILLK